MREILGIVLPVFGLIGIGAAVAWTKLLGRASGDALSEFVFVVAIPLLIFRIMATADLGSISAWRLWLSFFAAFALSWIAGTMLARRLFGRDARAGLVAGLAAGYGNTTLIGIPARARRLRRGRVGADGPHHRRAASDDDDGGGAPDGAGRATRRRRRTKARSPAPCSDRSRRIWSGIRSSLASPRAWRGASPASPLSGLPADLVNRLADVAGTLALFSMGMSLKKLRHTRQCRGGSRADLAQAHRHAGAGSAFRALRRLAAGCDQGGRHRRGVPDRRDAVSRRRAVPNRRRAGIDHDHRVDGPCSS